MRVRVRVRIVIIIINMGQTVALTFFTNFFKLFFFVSFVCFVLLIKFPMAWPHTIVE